MASGTSKDHEPPARATEAESSEATPPGAPQAVGTSETELAGTKAAEAEAAQANAAEAGTSAGRMPTAAAAGLSFPGTAAGAAPESSAEPWGRSATDAAAAPADGSPSGGHRGGAGTAEAIRSSGGHGLLWAIVVLLVLTVGAAAAWFGYIQPRSQQAVEVQPADLPAEIDAALNDLDARQVRLKQQMDALAPRIDALERSVVLLQQSVDRLPAGGAAVDPALLQQLADRVSRLESQAAAATSLAQQVRSLEASTALARDTAAKLATTVISASQLAQAVESGGPFVRQLAAVRALGGDDPDIAQLAADLEPLASSGVPTPSALRLRFPETADAIARAEPATSGDGWTDQVVDRLASLVTVRRTGPQAVAAGGVDGLLAQAEIALQAGDLRSAVTALERLEGRPREAAVPWLDAARQRLRAEQAVASLQQRAIARLSAAKG